MFLAFPPPSLLPPLDSMGQVSQSSFVRGDTEIGEVTEEIVIHEDMADKAGKMDTFFILDMMR